MGESRLFVDCPVKIHRNLGEVDLGAEKIAWEICGAVSGWLTRYLDRFGEVMLLL
jgi:hypothetical protein